MKSFTLADRKTQLVLASIASVLIVILALVALPGSNNKKTGLTTANGSDNASSLSSGAGPLSGASSSSSAGGSVSTSSGSISTAGVGTGLPPGTNIAKLPPLTATTIKIGMTYIDDPGTANAAAGFGAVGQIDQKRGWDAMVKMINQNPPLGRKVIPVYYHQTTNEVQSKGSQQIEQEACSYFTKDNPVYMVWDGFLIGGADTFHSCATQHHIPELGGSVAETSKTFQQFPYLVDPDGYAFDRMAANEVDQLYAQHFFSGFKNNVPPYTPQKPVDGKPKIGLIRYDTPGHNAAAAVMKAHLAQHGLSLCSGCEFLINYSPTDESKQLDDATEVNTAIANAKAKGVTHMMFLGTTAGVRITLFYVDGAEKQQYRPRLGFNPQDAPTAVRDFQATTQDSYNQYVDSVFVADSPAEFDQHTDAWNTCKKLLEQAGETFTGSQASNKEGQMSVVCDPAWYYQATMKELTGSLTPASWMTAVGNMKGAPSAQVYLAQTRADRHDASGAVRDGDWYDSCKCFKPVTPIVPV